MSTALRIGLAGLGTVGCGLVQLIQNQDQLRLSRPIEIVGVSARSRSRRRDVDISAYSWFDDPIALAKHPELDVLVELIGGADGPARLSVEAALSAQKSVVTANKALIAEHGMSLSELAEDKHASLLFEAAIAGAIPIVRSIHTSLSGTKLTRISGILNGTCNYILSQMRRSGQTYAQCLAQAQSLGYAEADPYLDVSGTDAAHKIVILAGIGFAARPVFERVAIAGIDTITPSDIALAESMGFRVRLIAQAHHTINGITCRVEPVLVDKTNPLFVVEDALNAVVVDTETAGQLSFTGPGAGADPTASAVMGDIASLLRGASIPPPAFGVPPDMLGDHLIPADEDMQETPWFIRVNLAHKSGAMAALSEALAKADVSIDALHQDFAGEAGDTPIVVVTHTNTRKAANAALASIAALPACTAPPCLLKLNA